MAAAYKPLDEKNNVSIVCPKDYPIYCPNSSAKKRIEHRCVQNQDECDQDYGVFVDCKIDPNQNTIEKIGYDIRRVCSNKDLQLQQNDNTKKARPLLDYYREEMSLDFLKQIIRDNKITIEQHVITIRDQINEEYERRKSDKSFVTEEDVKNLNPNFERDVQIATRELPLPPTDEKTKEINIIAQNILDQYIQDITEDQTENQLLKKLLQNITIAVRKSKYDVTIQEVADVINSKMKQIEKPGNKYGKKSKKNKKYSQRKRYRRKTCSKQKCKK